MSANRFDDFVSKYGTPLSILIGAVVIGGSIFFSLNPEFRPAKSAGTGQPAVQGAVQNISTAGLPVLGKESASVAIVEFGDFQCPYCGAFFRDTLSQIKRDYVDAGKVKFYYNNFAFLGAESIQAAEAAKCADDQGKFWDYHDYLYAHQDGENKGAFSSDNLKKFAADIGLNQNQFGSCLDTKKYSQAVQDETARGKQYGVNSTPTSFINGEQVRGAVPYDTVKAKIEEKLKK